MKNLSKTIGENYQRIACALISLYFLCALEVSTMLHYLPLVPQAAKACRYLIYAALLVLWAVGFCQDQKVRSFRDFFHSLLLWLINHLLFVLLAFTAALIFLSSGSLIPAALLMMYLVLQYGDLRDCLKWIFISQAAAGLLVIGLSLAGVIDNLAYPAFLRGTRYSLGYIFPLELQAHFLSLSLLYLYLYPKQHGWKSFLGISLLNFGLYHFTIARTSFALAEAAAVLSLITAYLPSKFKTVFCAWKGWKRAVPILTVLVFVSFILVCFLYNPHKLIWERLDDMVSGRLRLGQAALETYPLTLFGQRIHWVGSGGPEGVYVWESSYNYVDNAYIKDLLDNGLVFWILEMLGFTWLQLRFLKQKRLMNFLIVWVFFALGMMEPRLILLPFGFLLILMETPAMAENPAVEAWFHHVFGRAAGSRPVAGWKKILLGGTAAVLVLCGMAGVRQMRIGAARKNFASDLLEHRDRYAWQLWTLEGGQDVDPVRLRKFMLEAVDSTSGYEKAVMDVQYSGADEEMSDDDFERISDLKEQQLERAWLQVLESGSVLNDQRLQEIKGNVKQIEDEMHEKENN